MAIYYPVQFRTRRIFRHISILIVASFCFNGTVTLWIAIYTGASLTEKLNYILHSDALPTTEIAYNSSFNENIVYDCQLHAPHVVHLVRFELLYTYIIPIIIILVLDQVVRYHTHRRYACNKCDVKRTFIPFVRFMNAPQSATATGPYMSLCLNGTTAPPQTTCRQVTAKQEKRQKRSLPKSMLRSRTTEAITETAWPMCTIPHDTE